MIEATCGACGAVARIAEADVPIGAKFVTCASCKARVPVPQRPGAKASAPGPAIPKPAIPPAIPKPAIPPAIPKPAIPSAIPKPAIPPAIPKPPAASSSNKPTLDLADLPAPKRQSPLAGIDVPSKPAPRSALAGAELPAPKSGLKPPAPQAVSLDLDDLMPPAPVTKPTDAGLADLPAPKARPPALADLPAPKARPPALADLPAPKAKSALDDLPAPKARPSALADLPAPKAKSALDDLPAPAANKGLDLGDLPAPKPAAEHGLALDEIDLPMPKPGADSELPAPKGFFDDLPQPASSSTKTEDLAPKGFFDDLPQPTTPSAKPGDPAPEGLFDDVAQPATPSSSTDAPAGGPDDIGLALDGDLDLVPPGSDPPLELESRGSGADEGPELDLGLPLGQDPAFADLALPEPSAKSPPPAPIEPGSPIKIKTPAKGSAPAAPIPIVVKKEDAADAKFDLAEDPHEKQGGAAAVAAGKALAKRGKPSAADAGARAKRSRTRLVLGSVLGLALLGSGGFYFYQKHAAAQAKADEIATQLATARRQLADAHPQHWSRAMAAAQRVLELEPMHGPALGLAAEAAFAGALDTGQNYDARIKQGRKLTQDGLGAGKTGPELDRAQALMTIAANQPDRAIATLQKLLATSPQDGWLHLYMGWAQLAKGDAAAALAAFEQAEATSPATKLPALFGRGQAKLLAADIEGARAAFTAVLEQAKDHVGAQVGLAATLPPQQSSQREAELLAIFERPDIQTADPRAVVQAWTMVGDIARTSGRLDIARERYRKALALSALDVPALTGLAAVELKDGKLQVARDLIDKALTANASDATAQLVAAELDVLEGKLSDAEAKLGTLAERTPPLPPLLAARMYLVTGKLLEAQGKDEDAIAAYGEGAKLAGELDLSPTMAAVTKLTDLAKRAPDAAKAAELRGRADALLSALAERAQEDAELSLTLGVAYLQAGDAGKAEDFLRRAAAMREQDAESRLQLGKALIARGQIDVAITQLREARTLDPKRNDIALELARTYQNAGRDREAIAEYDKLLADSEVPVIVRVHAGRYFASKGELDKAAAQAEAILAAEPDNAGGLYLKGEGLILAKKWPEARVTLTRATDLDAEAQYLDALGRAFEGSAADSGDTKWVESARHAYERATKADPKLFHAQLGLGRVLVKLGKFGEAIEPLSVASQLDKSNADVMYQMGLAFFGVRHQSPAHKKTAVDWLESALKRGVTLSLVMRADAAYRLGELYIELNKAGDAARSLDTATRLAEELQKPVGTTPDWLVESYYKLGQMYYSLGNYPAQKRAWQRYVDAKPRPSARLTEAETALATSLKRY